jgi:exoribonuclease R
MGFARQEGEPRLTKSVFITLISTVVKRASFANSVIESTKRLTYEQASCSIRRQARSMSRQGARLTSRHGSTRSNHPTEATETWNADAASAGQ